jgi:hypothetical protein
VAHKKLNPKKYHKNHKDLAINWYVLITIDNSSIGSTIDNGSHLESVGYMGLGYLTACIPAHGYELGQRRLA